LQALIIFRRHFDLARRARVRGAVRGKKSSPLVYDDDRRLRGGFLRRQSRDEGVQLDDLIGDGGRGNELAEKNRGVRFSGADVVDQKRKGVEGLLHRLPVAQVVGPQVDEGDVRFVFRYFGGDDRRDAEGRYAPGGKMVAIKIQIE